MNTKLFLGTGLTLLLIGGNVLAAPGYRKAKVTMDEAQTIALKRIPGTVESSKMDKKDYSFEIFQADGIKTSVTVSPRGKIKGLVDK